MYRCVLVVQFFSLLGVLHATTVDSIVGGQGFNVRSENLSFQIKNTKNSEIAFFPDLFFF